MESIYPEQKLYGILQGPKGILKVQFQVLDVKILSQKPSPPLFNLNDQKDFSLSTNVFQVQTKKMIPNHRNNKFTKHNYKKSGSESGIFALGNEPTSIIRTDSNTEASNVSQKGIFDRIRERLEDGDFDGAYTTIIQLRFIKLPLVKQLIEFKAWDLIKKLYYSIDKFSKIWDLIINLIPENYCPDLIQSFPELSTEQIDQVISLSLMVKNTDILDQILKHPSFNKDVMDLSSFICVCMNGPKLNHLELLLKSQDLNYPKFLEVLLQQNLRCPNQKVMVLLQVIKSQIPGDTRSQAITDCQTMMLSEINKHNHIFNWDVWYTYFSLTSLNPENHPNEILKAFDLNTQKNKKDQRTQIFSHGHLTQYAQPMPGQCREYLSHIQKKINKEKDIFSNDLNDDIDDEDFGLVESNGSTFNYCN